jgi:hypothetical protein
MACGLEIPTLDTWDADEPVLYPAEKYDTMGSSSIIWTLLCTSAFADSIAALRGGVPLWVDRGRACSFDTLA